jgi:hypothetical protein
MVQEVLYLDSKSTGLRPQVQILTVSSYFESVKSPDLWPSSSPLWIRFYFSSFYLDMECYC